MRDAPLRSWTATRRVVAPLPSVGVALLASAAVVAQQRTHPRRPARAVWFVGSAVVWPAAPAPPARVTSDEVAQPPARGRSDLRAGFPSSAASVALVRHLREVTVSQMGGLYGP